MQQQQQQRRMFTAALLALVFLLAAVSTTEAGKKEKPGKVQSNSELIPKTDCKCGRMSNAGFVVKFRSFVNLLTSQGRICGCDMLFCVKQGNRKGFPCQVAAWHPQRLESLVYHTQWILQSSLKCALWRVSCLTWGELKRSDERAVMSLVQCYIWQCYTDAVWCGNPLTKNCTNSLLYGQPHIQQYLLSVSDELRPHYRRNLEWKIQENSYLSNSVLTFFKERVFWCFSWGLIVFRLLMHQIIWTVNPSKLVFPVK